MSTDQSIGKLGLCESDLNDPPALTDRPVEYALSRFGRLSSGIQGHFLLSAGLVLWKSRSNPEEADLVFVSKKKRVGMAGQAGSKESYEIGA